MTVVEYREAVVAQATTWTEVEDAWAELDAAVEWVLARGRPMCALFTSLDVLTQASAESFLRLYRHAHQD